MIVNKDSEEYKQMREAYETYIGVALLSMDVDKAASVVDKHVVGFGTTVEEKIVDIKGFCELVKKQTLLEGRMDYERFPISERILESGKSVVIVEEVKVHLRFDGNVSVLDLRLSSVFDLIGGKWKLVNWHSSSPVMSEDDTWQIEDWKKRNKELELKISQRTIELEQSLEELKATQAQLIQQEKLASLGQLAAGISHEIKNPINFVNNFSELSLEFASEIQDEIDKLEKTQSIENIEQLLQDISQNLRKINMHGKRVDNIVKSMLMHSRGGVGKMEPTNLNDLIREYVNLAFHGMRAGKNAINVSIELGLDPELELIDCFAEDFSRVILNLCKNAFDAMRDKVQNDLESDYLPTLKISTKTRGDKVEIFFEDNGPGVSKEINEKLFIPFFTTKKGTEGTGLGLSITLEIIKNHNGDIHLVSEINKFTRFEIRMPINQKSTK